MKRPEAKDFLLPPKITQKEMKSFEKRFKEITPLGFGLNYKSRWDLWSSVREFVQNAFDITTEMMSPAARSSSFGMSAQGELASAVSLDYDAESKIGYIEDKGPGIKFRHIFLSESKGKNSFDINCLRGQFGEGMKFAIIPILRDGHQVLIRTVGSDYHFSSVTLDDKGDDAFDLIHVFRAPNKITQGTCVAISGVDPTVYRDKFVPFLKKEQVVLSAPDKCQTRNVLNYPGQIFIRDVYLAETPAYFGYNFWFKHPTKMTDPDRSSFKANKIEEIAKEFGPFYQLLNKPEGRVYWKNLLQKMLADKSEKRRKAQKLEWAVLEAAYEFFDGDFRTDDYAESLFTLIIEVVGTGKVSWSENYDEGRILEHLGYINLDGKLPNLLRLLRGHVQTPREIKELKELKTGTTLIHPLDFPPSIRRPFLAVYDEINYFFRDVLENFFSWSGEPIGKVYFYQGDYKEEGRYVGGFSSGGNVFIKFDDLINNDTNQDSFSSPIILSVLHHEMAHVACYRKKDAGWLFRQEYSDDNQHFANACQDLTETFENTLEEVARAFMESPQELKELTKKINNFQRLLRRDAYKRRRRGSQGLRFEINTTLRKIILERTGDLALQLQEINTLEKIEKAKVKAKTKPQTATQRKNAWLVRIARERAKRKKQSFKAQGRLARYANRTVKNPVSDSGSVWGHLKSALPVKNFKESMLYKFHDDLASWLRDRGFGTRGFTVLKYPALLKWVTQQEGAGAAEKYRNPATVGALLITCRDYDNLCQILRTVTDIDLSAGFKQFKKRWFKTDDSRLEQKIDVVKNKLREELGEILADLDLELGKKLPFILKIVDRHHYKAGVYHVYPINITG